VLIGLFAVYGAIAYFYRKELKGNFVATMTNQGSVHGYLIIKSLAALVLVLAGYMFGYDLSLVSCLGGAAI
jgi:hypothetical protein